MVKTWFGCKVRAVFLALAIGLLMAVAASGDQSPGKEGLKAGDSRGAAAGDQAPESGTVKAHVYFGAESGSYLRAEQVRLEAGPDPVLFGRRLLEALIAGPRPPGRAVLPTTTVVRSFFIRSDGTAYVDLESKSLEGWPFSALSELLAVYAIVDTLVVNLDQVDAVKITLDGTESPTLAGHVDLSQPLAADLLWVR